MDIEQARQQAQSENTAPEILVQLANSKDYEIRQYVAGNPNTPVETLDKLGKEFPNEITANPIFNLLLLENPGSLFVRISLARSNNTSKETLTRLANDLNPKVRYIIAWDFNISPDILSILARDSESSVRFAVALNPNTSPDILSILAKDSASSVRRRVVFNPNTSSKILRELLNDRDNDVINSAKNRLKNK